MTERPQAVVLCGGRGTRLHELTEAIPKPMVPVGGRPILWHILRGYAQHGVRRFVLCLGYRGDVIRDWVLNYATRALDFTVVGVGRADREVRLHRAGRRDPADDWEITCVETGLDAQTGARLMRVAGYLDGDAFHVTYGDGLADVDAAALMRFHREHGAAASVTGVRPLSRFGELDVDDRRPDLVRDFAEKPAHPTSRINGGFFVFDRRLFDVLADDDGCTLEGEPLRQLARDGQLRVYRHDGYWQCMDTHRDLMKLEEEWRSGRPGWKTWTE